MKRWLNKATSRPLTSLLLILGLNCGLHLGHAGVINLLRGEPAPPAYQRVAFVGSAVVKQVSGRAEYLAGIEKWKTLKEGSRLTPGDIIRTQQGSILLRMTESQSFVKVTPNTVFRLVKIEKNWDRSILSGREERTGFIVRSCRGKAFFDSGNGEWMPVEVNNVLARGTEIRTAPGTVLDLFHTGTKRPVRIPGSSEVKLDEEVLARRTSIEPSLAAAAP